MPIGPRLEGREEEDRIDGYPGPRLVTAHPKVISRAPTRITVPEHRPRRGERPPQKASPEERELQSAEAELSQYADELKKRSPGRGRVALRRMLALRRDYPREEFLHAVTFSRRSDIFER